MNPYEKAYGQDVLGPDSWRGINEYLGSSEPSYYGPNRPLWDQNDEAGFMDWWKKITAKMGWGNSLPDELGQDYDYRAAYQRGYQPGSDAHWPSDLKYLTHGRRFINGYDTATGGLAPLVFPGIWEK